MTVFTFNPGIFILSTVNSVVFGSAKNIHTIDDDHTIDDHTIYGEE